MIKIESNLKYVTQICEDIIRPGVNEVSDATKEHAVFKEYIKTGGLVVVDVKTEAKK